MPHVPPDIAPLLGHYRRMLDERLPGFLEGLYLHGSVALGAFEPRLSDIDFIAVAGRRCRAADLERLRAIHEELRRAYPRWQLEGSYLCWGDLGLLEDRMPPHPHIHDGVLSPSGHHDDNAVTWWVLKRRGVTLLGPPAAELDITVDEGRMLAAMRHNLNTYWASFTTAPGRVAWLLDDYGVQWTVLGVLRQLYTFREHDITSKSGAGAYALEKLPERWHRLVREALRIRAGTPGSLYRLRAVRALEAHGLLSSIIAACRVPPAG